jgi:hypothetical protein
MEERLNEFLTYARRAYGDLQNPDYGFFAEALTTEPWRPVVDQLRQFLRVEDWTDREDDVSFSYVLKTGRRSPAWSLWLSAVGPFALLVYIPGDADLVRADAVTKGRADRPPEEARIVGVLQEAGLQLLSAEEVEASVDFRPMDGRFPVSVFLLLFGDSDVPWWHVS